MTSICSTMNGAILWLLTVLDVSAIIWSCSFSGAFMFQDMTPHINSVNRTHRSVLNAMGSSFFCGAKKWLPVSKTHLSPCLGTKSNCTERSSHIPVTALLAALAQSTASTWAGTNFQVNGGLCLFERKGTLQMCAKSNVTMITRSKQCLKSILAQ